MACASPLHADLTKYGIRHGIGFNGAPLPILATILACWAASFVFPADRSSGLRANISSCRRPGGMHV
jgi:hypothetical protein